MHTSTRWALSNAWAVSPSAAETKVCPQFITDRSSTMRASKSASAIRILRDDIIDILSANERLPFRTLQVVLSNKHISFFETRVSQYCTGNAHMNRRLGEECRG